MPHFLKWSKTVFVCFLLSRFVADKKPSTTVASTSKPNASSPSGPTTTSPDAPSNAATTAESVAAVVTAAPVAGPSTITTVVNGCDSYTAAVTTTAALTVNATPTAASTSKTSFAAVASALKAAKEKVIFR
jgi:hypothetical protein